MKYQIFNTQSVSQWQPTTFKSQKVEYSDQHMYKLSFMTKLLRLLNLARIKEQYLLKQ